MKPAGVLALQGDYARHCEKITELGSSNLLVKNKDQLSDVASLVIPGGESTTLLKLLDEDFREALVEFSESGKPVFATCAGAILVAKAVTNPSQFSLSLIDIDIERNSYGRQVDSSVTEIPLTDQGQSFLLESQSFIEGVFIRAPRIKRVGENVEVLATLGSDPVLVRCRNVVVATFHPELSDGNSLIHANSLGLNSTL